MGKKRLICNYRSKNKIINFVVRNYGLKKEDVLQKKRGNARISEARQLIAFLLLQNLDYTLEQVGEIIKRDHATVIHAKRVIEYRIATNQLLVYFDG